ncbi:MAG TPA: hypothetical protein VNB54_11365 [Alphaproteobacteria bacterium]|nr:hypothetical protein [Alphaproteobacteria bacterium]
MHGTSLSSPLIRLLTSTTSVVIASVLFLSALAAAQDSPGRFEAGGAFSTLHMPGFAPLGPALEGDVNFGRYIALDGAFSWFPNSTRGHSSATGFFGAKAGKRWERFGLFGKVRPGFLTFGNVFRQETVLFTPAPVGLGSIGTLLSIRSGRLTERALDLGGVAEYYPARHWALRWDFSDMLLFQEKGPTFTFIGAGTPPFPSFTQPSPGTTNHFQFSTGIHYRF